MSAVKQKQAPARPVVAAIEDEAVADGDDDDDGEAGVLAVAEERDPILVSCVQWDLSSSDEEAAPPAPRPRAGGLARALRAAAAAVAARKRSSPVQPPPPPPPGAPVAGGGDGPPPPAVEVPADAAGGVVARQSYQPRVCRVSAWPTVLHSPAPVGRSLSRLRMSQTFGNQHYDFRAICQLHDGNCQLGKSGKNHRPVGRLWAWLDGAADFGSAEDHKRWVPTLAQRCAARAQFQIMDGVGDFLSEECGGAGGGEPERTW